MASNDARGLTTCAGRATRRYSRHGGHRRVRAHRDHSGCCRVQRCLSVFCLQGVDEYLRAGARRNVSDRCGGNNECCSGEISARLVTRLTVLDLNDCCHNVESGKRVVSGVDSAGSSDYRRAYVGIRKINRSHDCQGGYRGNACAYSSKCKSGTNYRGRSQRGRTNQGGTRYGVGYYVSDSRHLDQDYRKAYRCVCPRRRRRVINTNALTVNVCAALSKRAAEGHGNVSAKSRGYRNRQRVNVLVANVCQVSNRYRSRSGRRGR